MTIPQGFKPMLAVSSDKVKTQPVVQYCGEKIDGVRLMFFGGVAYSRSLKLIPNSIIQDLAKKYQSELEGCDGEVIAGVLYAKDVLQRSVGFCMSDYKQDDFKIYLFDRYIADSNWLTRYFSLKAIPEAGIEVLPHYFVRIKDGNTERAEPKLAWVMLDEFEAEVLARGGEGVMVRDANATYKFGRSGTKNPELQKLKRFVDDEFVVVGYTQFEHNTNEATVNELGRTARSTSKEGKVAVDALGSLVCQLESGKTFNVGTGFNAEQRSLLWASRDKLIGKLAKVKFFHYSPDGIPLLPVFLDFRDERDV
jgi:DNA ligase-1